jgi:hypothetical protein
VLLLSRPGQSDGHDKLRELGFRFAVLPTHQAPRTAIGQIHAVATRFMADSRRKVIRVGCGDDLRGKARIQEYISQRLQEEMDDFLR